MDIRRWTGVLLLLLVGAPALSAQDYGDNDEFQARLWLDRGNDALLQRGDRVRIYYRASSDAYVAIFHIDTDGTVHLLSPRTPDDDHYVRGGRDYRLLFPQSPYWFVDEYPGKGYFFILASPDPFDFSAFEYTPYERGWDLSQVGRTVYQDPYVAIDEYVARLLPDWQTEPYALDFLSYDVGEAHDYPRFLCYDCHGYRAYSAWNPYTYSCSSFRVVIWDDPYFYPSYRYRGTQVVFAQPPRGLVRFEFKERAAGETWKPLIRTRQPPMRRSVEYNEPAVAAPAMPEFVPPRRRTVPNEPADGGGARSAQPTDRRSVTPDSRTAEPTRSAPSGSGLLRPAERPSSTLGGRGVVAPPTSRGEPSRDPGSVRPPLSDPRAATPRSTDPGTTAPRTGTPRVSPPSTSTDPRAGQRPILQRRPSTPSRTGGSSGNRSTPVIRPSGGGSRPSTSRPSTSRTGGGARVTPPKRTGGSNRSAPATRRPSSGTSRPPSRPPTVKRKPGGGGPSSSARARRPGGGRPA